MNKRGQAALEFLMTYGWAILAAVIVIGVLWFLIGNPTNLVGTRFLVSSPLVANGVVLTTGAGATDTVQVEVRNGAGESITITDVAITNCGSWSGTIDTPNGNLTSPSAITCSSDYAAGDRLASDVTITYTTAGSSLSQQSTGTITGRFP